MAKIQRLQNYVILFDDNNKVIKSMGGSTVIADAKLRKYAKDNNLEVK